VLGYYDASGYNGSKATKVITVQVLFGKVATAVVGLFR